MNIYLLRHTKPDIETNICYGQSDIDVDKDFHESAELIRKFFRGCYSKNVSTEIFTSPLQRCLKLAQWITKTDCIVDDRLMELDFGDWELKSWDSIAEENLTHWANDVVNMPCPDGESYIQLFRRCQSFWEERIINNNFPCDNIIIVTHGGVIRALLTHILSIPLEKSFLFRVDYASISKISINKEITEIQWINFLP